MKPIHIVFLAVLLQFSLACSPTPKSESDKMSYAFGVQIAKGVTKQPLALDENMIHAGISDVLKKKSLKMNEEEIQTALLALSKSQEQVKHENAENQKEIGRKFLEEFIKKNSAQVTPKGSAYRVIKQGTGAKALNHQSVRLQYEGKLVDGTLFDSSKVRGKPAEFLIKNVMPGWQEILTMMPAGSHWEVVIPARLAYGESGNQLIPPNSTVIFDLELLEVH